MTTTTVFVVSGDAAVRDSLAELIGSAGLNVTAFASLDRWREAVAPEQPGCLVLDAHVRDVTGPEHPGELSRICSTRPVLMLINRGDVPIAVRAMRDGVVDVLEKPYRDVTLLERVMRTAAAASV